MNNLTRHLVRGILPTALWDVRPVSSIWLVIIAIHASLFHATVHQYLGETKHINQ